MDQTLYLHNSTYRKLMNGTEPSLTGKMRSTIRSASGICINAVFGPAKTAEPDNENIDYEVSHGRKDLCLVIMSIMA